MTTDKLLELLDKLGLNVTGEMLRQDTHDHYLPSPTRRGRQKGDWPDWAVSRAVRLYRLRKLGLRGQVLKVFLFYRDKNGDGWGWNEIRPICAKALRMLIKLNKRHINKYLRYPIEEKDKDKVSRLLQDINEETKMS